MINVACLIVCVFTILWLMGIGPIYLLFSSSKQARVILYSLPPMLGLSIIVIIGTWLVLLDYKISIWAIPLVAVSLFFSLICFIWHRKRQAVQSFFNYEVIIFFIGLMLVSILLFLPMIIGKLPFTFLRGNGEDMLNYVLQAGFLVNKPYSWLQFADSGHILGQHAFSDYLKGLLNTRWSTGMILGWVAVVTHMPILKIEFGFTLLFFMLAYCPFYWFARYLRINPLVAMLASIAFVAGFWGQLILDIRAMSQINALPFILSIALLVSYIGSDIKKHMLLKHALLGVFIAAVIYSYIEISSIVALSLMLFVVLKLIYERKVSDTLLNYLLTALVTLVLIAPNFHFLLTFFYNQMLWLTTGVPADSFATAYFNWLYQYRLVGLWGFSVLIDAKMFHHLFINGGYFLYFLQFISLILTVALCYQLLKQFTTMRKVIDAAKISAIFVLVSLLCFGLFYFKGNLWGAAKAISYGIPFFILLLLMSFSSEATIDSGRQQQYQSGWGAKILINSVRTVIIVWLLFQSIIGVQRIVLTAHNKFVYSHYIVHHGEYQQHDCNIDAIYQQILNNSNKQVLILVHDLGLKNYLLNYLAWSADTYTFDNTSSEQQAAILRDKNIDYMIINLSDSSLYKKYLVSQNDEIALINMPRDFCVITQITNPNGIESHSNKSFIWVGNQAVTVSIYSSKRYNVTLNAELMPGPADASLTGSQLILASGSMQKQSVIIHGIQPVNFRLMLEQGINNITLYSTDPVKPMNSLSDKRTLLVGVLNLHISDFKAVGLH